MISARTDRTAALGARLAAKATTLAEAHLASRNNPIRWRRPDWLWPLFAKER